MTRSVISGDGRGGAGRGVSRLLAPGAIATTMLAALAGLELLGLPTFAIPFVATATILATAPGSPLARTRTVVLEISAVVSVVDGLAADVMEEHLRH